MLINNKPSLLRVARLSVGLRQADLATAVCRSKMYVSRLERGLSAVLTEEIATRCAAATGISSQLLFMDGTESEPAHNRQESCPQAVVEALDKFLPRMRGGGTMTPAQAIRAECRWCIGAAQSNCTTTVCKLHPAAFKCRSSVKRVRAHCLDCAAQDLHETRHEAVATCDGHLLRENGNEIRWTDSEGVERGVCFLLPYRFGKNPSRRKMSPEARAKQAEALAKHRPRPCKRGPFSPPGSTISPPVVLGGRK
jgi:transcriptional regulator with XRE-family HTH domain